MGANNKYSRSFLEYRSHLTEHFTNILIKTNFKSRNIICRISRLYSREKCVRSGNYFSFLRCGAQLMGDNVAPLSNIVYNLPTNNTFLKAYTFAEPDRPYHNLGASKSVDRRICVVRSIGIFWGSLKLRKGRSGRERLTSGRTFIFHLAFQ